MSLIAAKSNSDQKSLLGKEVPTTVDAKAVTGQYFDIKNGRFGSLDLGI